MGQGLFITVEGMDGSGKSTQINMMEGYLRGKGYDVVLVREPGSTGIGEKIRDLILDRKNSEMGFMTELLLYASARAQLVSEVIKPAVEQGKIVVCDRFVDSSYAYQGFGRGIDLKIIADVNRAALDGMAPDITIFLDISPKAALNRRLASTDADRIESEKMDFHMRVYSGYKKLSILYPERIKTIDSDRPVDEIFDEVKECMDKLMKD